MPDPSLIPARIATSPESVKPMIGQLPLTGDGFPIGIGGRVWFISGLPEDKPVDWAEVSWVSRDEIKFRPCQRVTWLSPCCCYSTREAALASAKKEPTR